MDTNMHADHAGNRVTLGLPHRPGLILRHCLYDQPPMTQYTLNKTNFFRGVLILYCTKHPVVSCSILGHFYKGFEG